MVNMYKNIAEDLSAFFEMAHEYMLSFINRCIINNSYLLCVLRMSEARLSYKLMYHPCSIPESTASVAIVVWTVYLSKDNAAVHEVFSI
jgi:hypothetical protein